jgi:DNA-binding NarL/FixJ family response regulator
MRRPRVLLADDHRIVSDGLRSFLADDFEVVGIVEDGRALVAAAKKLQPDVIVADISMPGLNGIEAVVQLRKDNSKTKVVLLTMHDDPVYARRALEAGAHGFVVKQSAIFELIMAINAALKGQTFISPALAGDVLKYPHRNGDEHKLTPRQRHVLRLLADGLSAKQIAADLAISPRTVEFHKYQMMESHGFHNSAELVHFAIKHGIVAL